MFTNLKAQKLTEQYFVALDAFWTWANNDNIYSKFCRLSPKIKECLLDAITNVFNTPQFKDKETFCIIALFQTLALSYCWVMDLTDEFPSWYSINSITSAMGKIIAQEGYVSEENSRNEINKMIEEKEKIIELTLQELENA